VPPRRALAAAARELGAALRIPAPARAKHPGVILGIALGCGMLAILACGAAASRGALARMLRHPRLAVSDVAVVGTRHAASPAIARLAGIRPGDPWFFADVGAARRRVRTHPWVEDATIERPWIGHVRIVVRECVPVALVSWGGVSHGLASDLTILPPAPADTARAATALPVIAGVGARGKRGIDLGSLERAAAYVQAIRREKLVAQFPVRLRMDPSGRDVIEVDGKGLEVVLETPIAPVLAVRNLAAFLETLDSPGECRGTLHVFSGATAVWNASGSGWSMGREDG
jgi:hypothetical protein